MPDAFGNVLKTAVTSFIGRVILALYTLLVVPLLPSVINFLNDILGYNLNDTQVNEYATNASFAIAGLAAVWLLNNGLFERAALSVKAIIDGPTEPTVPPGLVE